MKNKKGFTLVELLAVIVVLAIIMVIATISVNKTITKTRTQAFEKNMDVAVKNAKRILTTEGKLTTKLLKESLDYDKNEYDYDVVELPEGGYLMRIISDESGKFKNVDFSEKSSNKYFYIENSDNQLGKNIIGLKINSEGEFANSFDDLDKKIFEDDLILGCTVVNNANKKKYEVGYEISFCNDKIYYNRERYEYVRGKSEDFYVIDNTKDTITLLAKSNLTMEGNSDHSIKNNFGVVVQSSPEFLLYGGLIKFADSRYWANDPSASYPMNVYEGNKLIKYQINLYINYLKASFNKNSIKGRLITYNELVNLDCPGGICNKSSNFNWLYARGRDNYWTSSAYDSDGVYIVTQYAGKLGWAEPWYTSRSYPIGVRPVIEISKSELQ